MWKSEIGKLSHYLKNQDYLSRCYDGSKCHHGNKHSLNFLFRRIYDLCKTSNNYFNLKCNEIYNKERLWTLKSRQPVTLVSHNYMWKTKQSLSSFTSTQNKEYFT